MFHCSAAEGQRFQEEATRITKLIEHLGNNPIKDSLRSNDPEIKKKKK